jgi:hypothetical protein
MTAIEPKVELDERFSSPGATPRSWSEVARVLDDAEMFWMSTVRRDGRPHVTPLPAIWLDGALHICVGPAEQKAKNLEVHPECVLTTGSNELRSGLDVIVEGSAARVTDPSQLERLAALWLSKLDWQFAVVDGGFRERAPEGSGDEYSERGLAYVFAIAPHKVLAFGKGEPFSQTRYRF